MSNKAEKLTPEDKKIFAVIYSVVFILLLLALELELELTRWLRGLL